MNNLNIKEEGEKTGSGSETGTGTGPGTGAEELFRINISKVAEDSLGKVLRRVNDGFEAGKVTRHELASWMLSRFSEVIADEQIREVRAEFFDEIALLEAILKKAKKSGTVSPDVKMLLQKHIGLDDTATRKKNRLT